MAYISGTLTDSNAPATLYSAMATALAAAGYILSDTVVIGANTYKVWQNPAANNPANLDWYLSVRYTTTGAGTIQLLVFEDFVTATDLGVRGPAEKPSYSTFAPEATYYSRYGATGYSLDSANWNQSVSTPIPATSFAYWISITNTRVIVLNSQEPTLYLYAGLYTPSAGHVAAAASSVFPLVLFKGGSSGSGGGQGWLTRYPKWTGTVGTGNSGTATVQFAAMSIGGTLPGIQIPTGSVTAYADREVSPIMLAPLDWGGGNFPLGTLIDIYCANVSGSVARGDTITVGGASHIFLSPNGGAVLFKAA